MNEAHFNMQPYPVPHKLKLSPGTIIDNPDAYKLVLIGMAEPYDKECAAMCPGWNPQIAGYREKQYRKLAQAKMTGLKKYDV